MTRLHDLDWPLRTARLTIRPATPDDVEATWRIRGLPEVAEWIGTHPATLEAHAETFGHADRLADTLVVELDGEVIGDLMFLIGDGWSQTEVKDGAEGTQVEVGWVFHPDHGGRGYATEAVRALVDLAFGPLGLRRVTAECFADNEASWRLMERLGMRREAHHVKDSLHRTKGWLDGYSYALLAEEWEIGAGPVTPPAART